MDTSSSKSDTFSRVHAQTRMSYGGLFYSGSVSGGFTKSHRSSNLIMEGSSFKIKFKVRKVLIQRPWLEPTLLRYPTIGIKGLKHASWSTGELDFKSNKGSFPLLPTAIVVAKDVEISASSFTKAASTLISKLKGHSSAQVCEYTICCTLSSYFVVHFQLDCAV